MPDRGKRILPSPGLSPSSALVALLAMLLPMPPGAVADTGVPAWLSGKPDLALREERCRLYEWVLNDADRQTDGAAGESSFARKRLVNLANKVADWHWVSPADEYTVALTYLVIGTGQPAHYEFRMTGADLEELLQGGACD
jgi:hypothetical protein